MIELLHAKYFAVLAILVYASVYAWRKVKEHRTIVAFGGYARKASSYVPFGKSRILSDLVSPDIGL